MTWGVFRHHDRRSDPPKTIDGIILLDAWAGRLDFPELKIKVKELHERWKPDSLIVERKASGEPLIQELRRMGVYVTEMDTSRANDKVTRTHAVTDMFSSGSIWAPLGYKWVEEVRDEMAAFPMAADDDLHDAAIWGLLRIRRGNLLHISADEEDEEYTPRPPCKYY